MSVMNVFLRTAVVFTFASIVACGPVPEPAGDVSAGQIVFRGNACGACHGNVGQGSASGPNISGSETAGIGAWTQAQFNTALRSGTGVKTLADGGPNVFCSSMARYPRLSDTQLRDLFAYVKSNSDDTERRGPCNQVR